MAKVSPGYQPLKGSERRLPAAARAVGPADPAEVVTVTIVVRRRPDGAAIPGFRHFATVPLSRRPRLSAEDFADRYGGDPEEMARVADFATKAGLKVVGTDARRRTVVASGTVEQMSRAFGVDLSLYEMDAPAGRLGKTRTHRFRGREGTIQVPRKIAEVIVGVFGLDDRPITKRNMAADPPNTKALTVPDVTKLYNFPTNSAAGQTIAIFSETGYDLTDIKSYYSHLPSSYTIPTITDVGTNGTAEVETTQDICIAASAAPGADIAVYFTTYTQKGWIDLISRVIHPEAGDPMCSVLSCSFYVANGDDDASLATDGISSGWLDAVTLAFQDAAVQGITICIASGDTGAQSKLSDSKAHVQYPASDPWVLSIGGTTIGNVNGISFDEYVWNDTFTISGSSTGGATGGGVSDHFEVPGYQLNANVPVSLNGGKSGRGVPDVAANASWNSGYYPIYCKNASDVGYPNPFNGNGTSAAAPLYAGLVALVNAALGEAVGFLNPMLYSLGTSVVRDLDGSAGPGNNSFSGVTGYSAGAGWDACTGLGRIDGQALLARIRRMGVYQLALVAILSAAE